MTGWVILIVTAWFICGCLCINWPTKPRKMTEDLAPEEAKIYLSELKELHDKIITEESYLRGTVSTGDFSYRASALLSELLKLELRKVYLHNKLNTIEKTYNFQPTYPDLMMSRRIYLREVEKRKLTEENLRKLYLSQQDELLEGLASRTHLRLKYTQAYRCLYTHVVNKITNMINSREQD